VVETDKNLYSVDEAVTVSVYVASVVEDPFLESRRRVGIFSGERAARLEREVVRP